MPIAMMRHCFRVAVRAATVPKGHPLYKLIQQFDSTKTERFQDTLHYLFWHYKLDPRCIETIIPVTISLYRETPSQLLVDNKSDQISAFINSIIDNTELKLYTNGSHSEEEVGAVVAWEFQPSRLCTVPLRQSNSAESDDKNLNDRSRYYSSLMLYLDPSEMQIPLDAELAAIYLAMLKAKYSKGIQRITIYTDSKRTLHRILLQKSQSSQ